MADARLGEAGSAVLAVGCEAVRVIARYWAKVVAVDGSDCRWWTGVVSGRGHGRFWLAPGGVVVAHRFAFTLVHGPTTLEAVEVQGNRCECPSDLRRWDFSRVLFVPGEAHPMRRYTRTDDKTGPRHLTISPRADPG